MHFLHRGFRSTRLIFPRSPRNGPFWSRADKPVAGVSHSSMSPMPQAPVIRTVDVNMRWITTAHGHRTNVKKVRFSVSLVVDGCAAFHSDCNCNGFSAPFTCTCGESANKHTTLVETQEERERRGHPTGYATPYKAMGGLTGFSSLAEGYLRLDPSGRGSIGSIDRILALSTDT